MSSTLDGRIELIGNPGQPAALGGSADVYRGRWIDRNSRGFLALKVIRASHLVDPHISERNARRLQRELDIWLRLDHENIVSFYGICHGIIPGRVALVSPWMEYGTVSSYIRRNPAASKTNLVDDIMNGVTYLHSQNVVHGDIKGNNVLIRSDGRALLTDFGRALIIDEIEVSKSLIAAAHWTAPEVLTNEDAIPLTTMSDVWSLGVTVFEIYVGMDRLWGGTRRVANVITRLSNGQVPAVGGRAQYPEVPQYLWDILERCWRFNPEHRPTARSALQQFRNNFLTA